MNDALLKVLSWVDTATVCNAIEVAQGKRGFSDFTRGTVVCPSLSGLPLVGYARTAKIASAEMPSEPTEQTQRRRLEYYRYVSESTAPSIMVIEDEDHPNCAGAYWGEINAQIHRRFGIAGVLTNGVMRDIDDIPEDFPILAGSVGPSHAHVHVTKIDVPVDVFNLKIKPGDMIHADRHGAVIIPPAIIPNMQSAIVQLFEMERIILDPLDEEEFNIEKLEEAWARFESIRV